MRRHLLACVAVLLTATTPALADTLHILAAGSLSDAIPDLLRHFPAGADTLAAPEFGPSGLLREKIEAGTAADLLTSADMDQARRLAAGHPERMVINFTRNRLCAVARGAIGLTTDNMLDKLLDPAVRVATSTPGADPGGDYAWAVFARAETVHPGARAMLEGKALKLVGGGDKTPLLVPGKNAVEGVFLADRADVMLGYCSGSAALLHAVPGLVSVSLPAELTVGPAYGMVLLNDKPVTLRFAAFIMSEAGQAILKAHGFDPTAYAGPVPPAGVLVQLAGKPAILLTPDRLGRLPAINQQVAFGSEHGPQRNDFSGPLLWTVLTDALGAIPPPLQVHSAVRVTGSDGYVAVLALGEISPEFASRPIQLATQANGRKLAIPRLVVPDEKRGGRSVRDVVRIDID